jgi:hypothetical protein
MVDRAQLWKRSGLHQFQIVQCRVTEHRDRFGVEVELLSPVAGIPAFIDSVLLAEEGSEVTPDDYPEVGSVLDAVTLDFMPWGELRLSARPSSVSRQREAGRR